MNRQTRTLVVVGLAILFASIATYGVFRALEQLPVREVEVATRFTVVAREPLAVGAVLQAAQLQLVPWPEAAPVQGGFATVEEVVGRGLISGVVANEPITESKLAPREAGGGLPPLITPGMRAMSVRVNDVIAVAGFVAQGTRVDVLVTMAAGQENMSRVVVSNVQILSAGTQIDQAKGREGQPVPASVVTLLVTPQDAERIALAQNNGQIMLALRNPLDVEPTKTSGVRVSALMASPNAPPVTRVVQGRPRVEAPPPPPPPPAPYTVEVIRGARRSREAIKQ
jgi:pilus assembly protein CpaB